MDYGFFRFAPAVGLAPDHFWFPTASGIDPAFPGVFGSFWLPIESGLIPRTFT
jgi:hypothetical protein